MQIINRLLLKRNLYSKINKRFNFKKEYEIKQKKATTKKTIGDNLHFLYNK